MAEVKLMTQKEYAAHRGCSAVAVHKAVKAKRISLIGDKIDPAVADIQWLNNTRARTRNVKPAATSDAVAAPPAQADLTQVADAAGAVDMDTPPAETPERQGDAKYMASRSSREEAESRMAWNKLLEQEGTLIRVDQVKAALAAALAPVREGLMQIPARLAPVLAAQADPGRVQTLLEAELHLILSQLNAKADTAVRAQA